VPGVKEVRGQGLMIAELAKPCGVLAERAEAGLLISVTADSVIRLVPPLILSSRSRRDRRHPGAADQAFLKE
jgi:acetylornithine aminotransferase